MPPEAGYFVDFQFEVIGRDPSPTKFVKWLRAQLAALPAYDRIDLGFDRRNLPTATYSEQDARIRVRFMPMRKAAPARTDPDARIVGSGPAIGGVVNAAARLKERVGAKAGGRYDLRDAPFLVAVGIHDVVCSDEQVLEAAVGGESIVLATQELVRRNDGLFGKDAANPDGRHRRLSGVAVINSFRPWSPEDTDIALFRNPYAALDRPVSVLPPTRTFRLGLRRDGVFGFDWEEQPERSDGSDGV